MAQAVAVEYDLTDFRLLCNTACQQNPVEFKNTEVVASILLDNLKLSTPAEQQEANTILNAHMENFQDIMDEQEELDERIAFGMSVTHKDTNDGSGEHEPIIRPPRRTAAAAPLAAAATNQYNSLITFFNYLKSPHIVGELIRNMNILNNQLIRICSAHAYVYNNILFFNPDTAPEIRDASLFPKYSFNILCNQNSFLLPQLLVLGERGIGAILQNFVCNVFNNNLFREYVQPEVIRFKICNPTDTNKLWQVKICLFGNEFTLISIQIISMSLGFFTPESIQNDGNLHLTEIQALLLSLYNKCLTRDFNCLCSLSELDIKLFRAIFMTQANIALFTDFIRHFFNNLSEMQLNVKKQYFIMGLYNLASCSSYSNYTPETRAYELLFNQDTVGINLFNLSMCFIKELNQRSFLAFPEQIRFAMGGGKLYSIFHKKLQDLCSFPVKLPGESDESFGVRYQPIQQLRSNVLQNILEELIKAAADADFGCFYPEEDIAAGGIGASSCMAICMLLQLSLKQLIDTLFGRAAQNWNGSEIDIGNSCIGTPPTTLSSLRIVLKNILRFYLINDATAAAAGATEAEVAAARINNDILRRLRLIFDLVDMTNIKATISPYDFVMKGSMKSYIVHIFKAVHSYRNTTIDPTRFPIIAEFLTSYCMVTQEGFSSPIKGILDIFYTLFIIENFANRTFVTQKINKELKRVAICAQILCLHYIDLQQNVVMQEQNVVMQEILRILIRMTQYGYGPDLLVQATFNEIMETYVNFVTGLCTIYETDVNYLYFCVAGVTRPITSIETSFMNLLPECTGDVLLPVFAQTLVQYDDVITGLTTMGPLRETGETTAQATTDLYLNKLYASCRDAENKKEGMVAIMSAYQAYLWSIDNIDKIRRNEQNDACLVMTQGVEGIIQHLLGNPNVFYFLFQIIRFFATADVLGMAASIQQINRNDILLTQNANAADDNAAAILNEFLVFSWFITSVFGVKTKSKPSKIISLGRTYLQLLCENPPLQEGVPHVEVQQRVREFTLFGLRIIIPAAAAAAEAAQVVIDNGIVPEIAARPQVVGVVEGNENNRLCLAYNQANISNAISKYIKMDIDMNITAARDAAAATQQALFDVQKVNRTNTISVTTGSLVFNQEIFSELIIRFSHLPRGNQYILDAAQYMLPIMRRICCLIDKRVQTTIEESIEESITTINPYYPYKPKPHDVSKFTMLNQEMKNNWLQYLINKIFAVEGGNPQTVFDNMKLFVLLYNYIGPLLGRVEFPNPPQGITYLDVVGELINEHFTGCQTVNEDLLRLSMRWESEEPREIAAAAKKKPNPTKSLNRELPPPVNKAAAAAAAAAISRTISFKLKRPQPSEPPQPFEGGNRTNHTRKNKYKRNNKNKKHKSSPKYRKVVPSSRSGSQSNRKKSKSKLTHKNVTFKRRRARK